MTTIHKPAAALIAGLALAGALASCAGPPDSGADTGADPGTGTGTGSAQTSAPSSGGSSGGESTYADGTYSATGSYQAPSGTESVEVTITLRGDVITDVQVVGDAVDPQAKQQQSNFIGGIADVVVGKDIDEISVSRVAGSSLTSGGFNAAVETIKGDAAA